MPATGRIGRTPTRPAPDHDQRRVDSHCRWMHVAAVGGASAAGKSPAGRSPRRVGVLSSGKRHTMSTTNDERAAQVRYWRNALHGTNYPSLNTLMLLDPDGEAYADEEVAGTLSLLPPVPRGALIVELAAGAGRF